MGWLFTDFSFRWYDRKVYYLKCIMIFISAALDKLGLRRYCCRRMILGHVDLIEKLLNYSIKRA